MKNFCVTVIAAIATLAASAQAADRPELKSEKDRVSYSIGLEVARNFKKNSVDFDPSMVLLGMNDGVTGERPLLSEKDFRRVIGEFQNQVRQKMAANMRVLTIENRKKAEEFLQANKSKDGVTTLAGGLQYKVLQAGQGALPSEADSVVINYRGMLLDGTQFDATDAGKPGTIKLFDLFNGLRAAIKHMPVGSHWMVWIPPQLGYGERGVGSDVGPNELLVYDLELVGIAPSVR
jgi:FKBP-type peptidyl-prolyl cis-trans isomerase FklB